MASGSHTWRGNCADLPIVPPKSSNAATETRPRDTSGPPTSSPTCWMLAEWKPVAAINTKMPNMNGTSPILVVMNALIAALELIRSSHQCPISR